MANIKVKVDYPISDGTKLKFRTPCESTEVEGLVVTYPVKNGVGNAIKTFAFVDAHGKELSGVGNVFTSDVLIEVLLDVTKGRAYVKNADTNSYIEDIKVTVKRMDEERQTIFAEAGKSVKECNDAAKTAIDAAGGVVTIEQNSQDELRFWVGTKGEYEKQKDTLPKNVFCILTDDTTEEEILAAVEEAMALESAVKENAENISTNTTNISKNAEGISKNAEDISTVANQTSKLQIEFDESNGTILSFPYAGDIADFDYFVGYTTDGTRVVFDDVTIGPSVMASGSIDGTEYLLIFEFESSTVSWIVDTQTAEYTKIIGCISGAVNPPAADLIVEQGTSGAWKYRKWRSGNVDLWARLNVTTNCTTAWGSLYYSRIDGLSFPEGMLIEMPYVVHSLQNPNAWMIGGSATKETTGQYFVLVAESTTNVAGIATFHVIGRWK